MAGIHELPTAAAAYEQLPVTMALDRGFQLKTSANQQRGIEIFRSGKVSPFMGYDRERFDGQFAVTVEFNHRSAEEITERVCGPLEAIAEQYGIQLVTAGNGDLPPHTTIEAPQIPNDVDLKQVDSLTNQSSALVMVTSDLAGLSIPFANLTLVGPTAYISMGKVIESRQSYLATHYVSKARSDIRTILENPPNSFNFASGSTAYIPLIHSTVARISGLSDSGEISERLNAFSQKAYSEIGNSLDTRPIIATAGRVHIGRASDIVEIMKPGIFSK